MTHPHNISKHIINRILTYVANSSSEPIAESLKPFLQVDQSWREAAQETLYYCCRIFTQDGAAFYTFDDVNCQNLTDVPNSESLLAKVKVVSISIFDVEAISSKALLDDANEKNSKRLIFPTAHTLYLEVRDIVEMSLNQESFEDFEDFEIACWKYGLEGAIDNCLAFVSRIEAMIPNLKNVSVCFSRQQTKSDVYLEMTKCILSLFKENTKNSLSTYIHEHDLSVIIPENATITNLDIREFGYRSKIHSVLQKNQLQLESLCVLFSNEFDGDVSEIVGYESDIRYEALETMHLEFSDIEPQSPYYHEVDDCLFPRLRNLTIKGCYPLDRDTMFENRGDTLEYLDVNLTSMLMGVLVKVFKANSHTKLRHAIFHICNDLDEDNYSNRHQFTYMLERMIELLPKTLHTLEFIGHANISSIIVGIANSSCLDLQYLYLDGYVVPVEGVYVLLQSLSNLRLVQMLDISAKSQHKTMSVEEYINNGELSQAKKGHSSAKIVVMAAANDFMASEEARNELKFCNKLLTFMFTGLEPFYICSEVQF